MDLDRKSVEKSNKKMKKDTKWNRISKKYQNTSVTKTETVKRFLNKNYINRNEEKNLIGSLQSKILDPVLVMDLRHEAIPRKKLSALEKSLSPIIEAQKQIRDEKREQRNKTLEKIAIDTEIKKFQHDLKKYQTLTNEKRIVHQSHDFTINNQNLYENLLNFKQVSNDFYKTCIKAPLLGMGDNQYDSIGDNDEEISSEDDLEDVDDEPCGDDEQSTIRMVRFEETIKIVNYSCEERYIGTTTDTNQHLLDLFALLDDEKHSGDEYYPDEIPNDDLEVLTYRSMIHGDQISSTSLSDVTDDDSNDTSRSEPRFTEILEPELLKSVHDESGLIITRAGIERMNVVTKNKQNATNGVVDQSIEENELNDETTERNQIISDLFDEKYYRATREYELKVLRKYFLKWSVMTTIERISDNCATNSDSRVKKITKFLNKIREEKRTLHETETSETTKPNKSKVDPFLLSKKYQHKCKYQQEVIELQKLKLERQERLITELKLSKMFEESKHSKVEMKTELRNLIRHGTVKLRAKAKCLQIAGNLKEEEDDVKEMKKLQASGNEVPKFLARMQARAVERHQKHEEVKEKRVRLEKEREDAKLAAEEAKRLEDEQAKKERFEALREKRRQEKLQKIQKELDRQKYMENMQKVNDYRRIKLLKCYGFDQFKKLILIKKFNMRKAKILRRTHLMRTIFRAWNNFTIQVWEKKKRKADAFCVLYTQKIVYRMWKNAYIIAQSKYMVATDLYELRMTEKVITLWNSHTKYQKMIEERKMLQAKMHYNWHLLWKALEHWQRLHIILKIEKETEERRQRWRIKIWELLPDYQPNTE